MTLADVILKQNETLWFLVIISGVYLNARIANLIISLGNLEIGLRNALRLSHINVLVNYSYEFCQNFLNYSYKVIPSPNNCSVCPDGSSFIPNIGDVYFSFAMQ